MKSLLSFLLVLVPLLSFCQEPLEVSFQVEGQHEEESIFPFYEYTLADKVLLRATPSRTAKVLTKLKIGSKLILQEASQHTMTLNGISSHWYKVITKDQIGWIWGGLIAQQTFTSRPDPEIRFVAGYEKASYDSESDSHKC